MPYIGRRYRHVREWQPKVRRAMAALKKLKKKKKGKTVSQEFWAGPKGETDKQYKKRVSEHETQAVVALVVELIAATIATGAVAGGARVATGARWFAGNGRAATALRGALRSYRGTGYRFANFAGSPDFVNIIRMLTSFG